MGFVVNERPFSTDGVNWLYLTLVALPSFIFLYQQKFIQLQNRYSERFMSTSASFVAYTLCAQLNTSFCFKGKKSHINGIRLRLMCDQLTVRPP